MSPQQDNPPDDIYALPVSSLSATVVSTGTVNNQATSTSVTTSVPTGGDTPRENDSPRPTSATTTHISIPLNAPAGVIVITEPPPGVGTSLYKISPTGNPLNASADFITFGWNLTLALVQPTQLTVRAACENGYTYPVGSATLDVDPNAATTGSANTHFGNGVIPGSQSQVVWDVVGYQAEHPETPLPQGMCTLQIADERGFTAARRAGYLSPNTAAVTFALYTGEAYIPLTSGWKCATCSSNSISSTYDAHPITISLLVSLIVCLLSGAHILFRANFRNGADTCKA